MPRAIFTAIRLSSAGLTLSLLLGSGHAGAGYPYLHTVGLAVHQETGRDIYVAALRSSGGTSVERFLLGKGTLLMEQRVVARRTSARSLLGNLLLQAELATGAQPSASVTRLISDLIDAVQGSLYRGDSLEIARLASGDVVAHLNDVELARSDDPAVFSYLLAGWTGDSGPSAAFREVLTRPTLDPDLASRYASQTADPERVAAVMAWARPSAAEDSSAAAASPQASGQSTAGSEDAPAEERSPLRDGPDTADGQNTAATDTDRNTDRDTTTVAMPLDLSEGAGSTATVVLASMDASAVSRKARAGRGEPSVVAPQPKRPTDTVSPSAAVEIPQPEVQPDSSPHGVSGQTPGTEALAALVNPAPMERPGPTADTAALAASEYSRRLGAFNDLVIRRVYAEIEYPRAAVRRSLEGALELDVTIGADGELSDVAIARSSGYRMLDGSAVRAAKKGLKRIDPEKIDPVAVAEYGGESGELVIPVPVSFRLQ